MTGAFQPRLTFPRESRQGMRTCLETGAFDEHEQENQEENCFDTPWSPGGATHTLSNLTVSPNLGNYFLWFTETGVGGGGAHTTKQNR